MELFLIALFSAVGLSHLLVDGSIFSKIRGSLVSQFKDTRPWIVEMISCYQCTGFWSGFLLGLILQPISWTASWYWCLLLWLVINPLVTGFASSYASMLGAGLLNYLDAPAMMNSNKNE